MKLRSVSGVNSVFFHHRDDMERAGIYYFDSQKAMHSMDPVEKAHHLVKNNFVGVGSWDENLREAECILCQALEEHPFDVELLICIGAVLCDQGRFSSAESALIKAIQSGSTDSNAFFNLGVVLINAATHKEAMAMFSKAQTLVASERTWQAYFDPMAN